MQHRLETPSLLSTETGEVQYQQQLSEKQLLDLLRSLKPKTRSPFFAKNVKGKN
jgi:hypothetical protein